MPFTVSHAAAVLPFRKLNLIWSAFIVGSMAPDFPYIVGNTDYRHLGHRFPGILYFTIPAAVVALWLFHNVIKRPIVGLLPSGIQARLRDHLGNFAFAGGTRFLAILCSIVMGIATHVVWDAFTHSYTWPWYRIAWLRGWVHIPGVRSIPTASAMQYLSTVGGLLALGIWVLMWYRRSGATITVKPGHCPTSRFAFALVMFAVAAVIGIIRAWLVIGRPHTFGTFDAFLLVFGVTALALAFWQLLFYCVLVSSHQVWTMN